jgi:hypothetical protein
LGHCLPSAEEKTIKRLFHQIQKGELNLNNETNERKELKLAREILATLPVKSASRIPLKSNAKNFTDYRDDYIHITGAMDSQALHVEVFPPLTEARSNPIIFVDDEGKCYRNHGERGYFILYAEKLLGKQDLTQVTGFGEERAKRVQALIP